MSSELITFGSICSGIEAASVAFGPLGWRAAWLAEIEAFPSAVLKHHYPTVPNLGDMTTIARRVLSGEVDAPDVLCGGTPCQAFSVAGLRNSLDDARGNLTLKFVELADAIDHRRDRDGKPAACIFWENVPGVLSTKDNAFGCFLAGLAGEDEPLVPPGKKWTDAGAVYGPRRAIAWRTLDAQYFGLAQRRRRVFVVASARDGFDPAAVLFEWQGVRRDFAPSRGPAKDVAGTVAGGARKRGGYSSDAIPAVAGTLTGLMKGDGLGRVNQLAFGGNNTSGAIDTAATLLAQGGSGRMDFASETFIAHSLRGAGFDASEDGSGRGTPLVFDTTQITSTANRSNPQRGDPCHPLAAGAHPPAIAFNARQTPISGPIDTDPGTNAVAYAIQERAADPNPANGPQSKGFQEECAYTLEARERVQFVGGSTVRRLTPRECERLQGFPDDYTRIPSWTGWRKMGSDETPEQCITDGMEVKQNKKTGRWRVKDVDGPRYKALGNSWAIPNVRWIGARIDSALRASA